MPQVILQFTSAAPFCFGRNANIETRMSYKSGRRHVCHPRHQDKISISYSVQSMRLCSRNSSECAPEHDHLSVCVSLFRICIVLYLAEITLPITSPLHFIHTLKPQFSSDLPLKYTRPYCSVHFQHSYLSTREKLKLDIYPFFLD